MYILWKLLIVGLVFNLAIVETEASWIGVNGLYNYFWSGSSNNSSNLEEDNDPKYHVDQQKWSEFYDELLGEISCNRLSLPENYVYDSIQRLNETSLYFRHLCLLSYDNLEKEFNTRKPTNAGFTFKWNARALKALYNSTESFKKILIERCQCPSHHLTDKYETYIKEIFTNNIFDFLIFINGQKTDEDVAEIKRFGPLGQSDLNAATKYYVAAYRTLIAMGER